MGREIKRVPLNFDWPLNEVWKGFLNPYWEHRRECATCGGSGSGPDTKRLSDQWYGYAHFEPSMTDSEWLTPSTEEVHLFARRNVERNPEFYASWFNNSSLQAAILIEAERLCDMWNGQWGHHLDQDDVQALLDANRLMDFTHTFIAGQGWQPKNPPYVPTAKEVNRWNILTLGHDSINQWACVKAKALRLGYELECKYCNGDGDLWPSLETKQAYDDWQREEPPTGNGWQVWETVSEGSPISPVFATDEDLVNWLIREGYSEGAAEQFVKRQWVPSMVQRIDENGTDLRRDIESLNMD